MRGALLLATLLVLALPAWASGERDFRLREHELALQGLTGADVDAEVAFGRDIAARILGRVPRYDDLAANRYVTLVGRALALQGNRPELDYHFAILDDDTINAYSAPGGYVFVTRGAIRAMADEAELAAVLAHEIAHVNRRHIVRQARLRARDDSGLGGLARLIGGSGDSARVAFSQAVDKAMDLLFVQGYNQRDELEADADATLMLAAAGYDPTALRRFLARIGESEARVGKTHPPSQARLAALDELIQAQGLDQLHYPTVAQRFRVHVGRR